MEPGMQAEEFADRAFFEALVQNGSDAIITIDTNDRILFANDATEAVFGYDPEELVGGPLTQIMPERFHDAHRAAIEAYLETGERTLDWGGIELPAKHADGHEIPVSITFAEYEHEGQRLFSGIIRDISDLAKREEQLNRQREQLERFASVVSHDLRSPIQTAKSTLAVARATDDEEALDELDDLLDRMDEIVNDVLKLATEGNVVDDPGPVALASVAEAAWTVAGTDDISFTAEQLEIEADDERLQTLLENLFRNAVEHGAPSTVRVTALEDGFAVVDDGRGFGDTAPTTLFEHGYTESDSGTGIGLSIVESIATAHGWDIEAGTADTGGARFAFHGVTVR